MKTLLFFCLLVAQTVSAQSYSDNRSSSSDYRLGPGDKISIQVYGEDDLSFETITLNDAGSLNFPFIGEIRINGLTADQVANLIRRGLYGDYLIDPKVSVRITEYRPFYVNGEVKSPGGYPFKPGLTIRKAVALAGGFTERASSGRMYLIREGSSSSTKYRVGLEDELKPGDILTIEQSFF